MPDTWWDEVTNGSNCKSKWLAKSICQLLTTHRVRARNIIWGSEKQSQHKTCNKKVGLLENVEKFTNGRSSVVYGLVDTLKMHL